MRSISYYRWNVSVGLSFTFVTQRQVLSSLQADLKNLDNEEENLTNMVTNCQNDDVYLNEELVGM
jgi:hypothetical protein